MATRRQTIADVIQYQLEQFNAVHRGVCKSGEKRLGNAIDKLNRNIDKVSIEVDGVDFDTGKVSKHPNPFPRQELTWQCLGFDLGLTVKF